MQKSYGKTPFIELQRAISTSPGTENTGDEKDRESDKSPVCKYVTEG